MPIIYLILLEIATFLFFTAISLKKHIWNSIIQFRRPQSIFYCMILFGGTAKMNAPGL